MMENYNKLRRPPATALRTIKAGRLKGKSDINPQWRYEVMTEVYGPCGTGWKFTIDRLWNEPGSNGAIFAFAQIGLQVKESDVGTPKWSEPIPGIGGHQLIVKESSGLYNNDEAFKMAVTDALSTAMKMLGVAADIYGGLWDGSKYIDAPTTKPANTENKKEPPKDAKKDDGEALTEMAKYLVDMARAKVYLNKLTGSDEDYEKFKGIYQIKHARDIENVKEGQELLKDMRKFAERKKKEMKGNEGAK